MSNRLLYCKLPVQIAPYPPWDGAHSAAAQEIRLSLQSILGADTVLTG